MTTLMSLSDEVIDIILSYSDISFEDIINFRCVCKKFRWAAKTEENCFFKTKFYQRWPSTKKYYDEQLKENEQKQSEKNKQNDKKSISFIETGIDYAKQLRKCVHKLMTVLIKYHSGKTGMFFLEDEYLEKELNIEYLSKLMFINKDYIKILFFMDEIMHFLDQPARIGCDLTKGYYYVILFNSLRVLWRNVILEKYSEQPCKELLEESATIWAQQLQLKKNISYSNVKASLKSIALEALNFLREKHPEHSIFSTPDDDISHWENHKIDDNYWNEAEGTQIMDTLEEYMFGKLKFGTIKSRELEYQCIDYVLENKKGSEIIVYIIYESVARRLGLRCDLAQTPYNSSINILWIPRYTFAADYKEDILLLDRERRKNMRCLPIYSHFPLWPNVDYKNRIPQAIYKKTAAETLKLIMSRDKFSGSFTNKNLILRLKYIMPQTRPNDIKFAVGMIVTHGDKSTDCSTGVIIGWLPNIDSNFTSFTDVNIISDSISAKKCSCFSAGQTCYIILTKNDKLCCVKEDDIALTKPNWIENINIYHYFSKFEGTHYVPNEKLAKAYPHDAARAAGTIFQD